MNKEETILYLRYLKSQNYIFSNFKLDHVLDFIDELQEKRTNLLKQIDKQEIENTNLKQALNDIKEYIYTNSHYYSTDDGNVNFVIEEEKEEIFCKDLLQIIEKVLGDEK